MILIAVPCCIVNGIEHLAIMKNSNVQKTHRKWHQNVSSKIRQKPSLQKTDKKTQIMLGKQIRGIGFQKDKSAKRQIFSEFWLTAA